jgi:hypothetical protein
MLTLTLTLALKLMPFVNGGRRSGWCHSLSTGDFDLKRPTNCIKYQGKCYEQRSKPTSIIELVS